MNAQDDDFEAYLRQFRLRQPKALPSQHRRLIGLAAAAGLVLAVFVPWQMAQRDAGAPDARPPLTSSTPAATESPKATELPTPVLIPRAGGLTKPGPAASTAPAGVMAGTANRRVRVGGGIKPPRRLVNVDPVYPQAAQAARIEGMVILDIVIGEDGSVIEAQVIRSIPELDQAAIDAVYQWKYEPTLLNGEPVEVAMNVTINFTLR